MPNPNIGSTQTGGNTLSLRQRFVVLAAGAAALIASGCTPAAPNSTATLDGPASISAGETAPSTAANSSPVVVTSPSATAESSSQTAKTSNGDELCDPATLLAGPDELFVQCLTSKGYETDLQRAKQTGNFEHGSSGEGMEAKCNGRSTSILLTAFTDGTYGWMADANTSILDATPTLTPCE